MGELFSRDHLLIVEEFQGDWSEAIKVCGQLMRRAGSIEEGYIGAMIDAVHEMGPYMVIAPHLAIAHAAAGPHVLKDDLVLVVFRTPVEFHSPNDPVHVLFGICATEPGKHLEQMQELAGLLDDDDVYRSFLDCKDIEALYNYVNQAK